MVATNAGMNDSVEPQEKLDSDVPVSTTHEYGGTKDFGFLPIPKKLQYDSERAFEFTTVLNITFGFASTFSKYQ